MSSLLRLLQLKRDVDVLRLELSLQNVICGRTRKNIRLIESATNTAIYFPPPFPRAYGYTPPGASARGIDEVFITGNSAESIKQAKTKIKDLVMNTKCYAKEVNVQPHKVDSILLERLDKVRKVMEVNGSYVLFPPLGSQMGKIRVQGTEILHVERTVRELMALVSTDYSSIECELLKSLRLGNSMELHGGSCNQILLKEPQCGLPRQQIFGLCFQISAQTLEQIWHSRNSPSQSVDRMTQ